jgi:hypothetical protein
VLFVLEYIRRRLRGAVIFALETPIFSPTDALPRTNR